MDTHHENHSSGNINALDEIQDGLSYLTGEPNVSLRHLITDEFIVENTDFNILANFLNAAGVKSEKDLEHPDFNDFVKKTHVLIVGKKCLFNLQTNTP